MYVQIDSLSMIYELTKKDILLDPMKAERYLVEEINDGHLILCAESEKRALRIITFPTLLKEKWRVELGKTAKQQAK
jgi:hypothetical protein